MTECSVTAADAIVRFDGGMASDVAPTPRSEVLAICADYYGLSGRIWDLGAERDEIFALSATGGRSYVLKIHNPNEKRALADLRLRALKHVEAVDPALPVPRIVPSKLGDDVVAEISDGSTRIIHLMTFLDGTPQYKLRRTAAQAFNIGAQLARLATALRDFSHPADERYLAWDLANAADLLPLLPEEASGRWHYPFQALLRFRDETSHYLSTLRRQVVHNDFNAHNLLMDPDEPDRVRGVLDFGDIARTGVVNDVAIAACYQLRLAEPGLAGAVDVVAGYHSINPLLPAEVELLVDLMATRLAIAVAITEWRAARYPERAAAILKNTGYAWQALERLSRIEREDACKLLHRACFGE